MKGKLWRKLIALAMAVIMIFLIVGEGGFGLTGAGSVKADTEIKYNLADYTVAGWDNATYTGSPITFDNDLRVYPVGDYNNPLSKQFYTVEYTNNTNAGEATMTITGIADKGCVGTITRKFTIKPRSGEDCAVYYVNKLNRKILWSDVLVRTGCEYMKVYGDTAYYDFWIKYGSNELVEGVDYTYWFANCDEVAAGDKNDHESGPYLEIFFEGNYTDSVTRPLTISAANMSNQNVSLAKSKTYKYTGSAITPEVSASDGQSGETLELGVDYEVSYEDNTAPGTGKVIVKGINNYTGEVELEFEIVSDDVVLKDIADAVVTVASCEYTGSELTPEVVVKYNGQTLILGTDYSVQYSNNINAGANASVTILGEGIYTGSKTENFTISKRDISKATVTTDSPTYAPSTTIYPTVIVKDEEVGKTLSKGNDYSVYFDNAEKGFNAGEHTGTLEGKGNYTGTSTFKYNILPASIKPAKVTVDEQEYTGLELTPECKVEIGSKTLVLGTDYKITGYSQNIQPGTATINIEGINNYTDTTMGTFSIVSTSVKPDLSNAIISTIAAQEYTGAQIRPDFTVTYNNENGETVSLTKDVDYTVEYGENITPADGGSIKITGMGDYIGSKTINFTINCKDIKDIEFDIQPETYTYSGEAIYPQLTLKYNGKTLVQGTDYEVSCKNNINATDSAEVTVTGK
ncbi:MAG: hypothetical protein ACI4EF_08440, partial [Coprococcus sp.]